ncbi:hypothetical protein [Cohnella sp. GCM10027633]|uniref:hypothetical protein n=1 Tax=unclassified Cohnella TaxID=2636738 RepID=UPI003643FAAF
MRKHNRLEVQKTAELVRIELVQLLANLGQSVDRSQALANEIIGASTSHLKSILDMPQGGSLSPYELAEMVLAQYVHQRQGHFSEESAAAMVFA